MVFASRQKSFQNIGKNGEIRNDGLVKGRNFINFVIPAFAGVTGYLTLYESFKNDGLVKGLKMSFAVIPQPNRF